MSIFTLPSGVRLRDLHDPEVTRQDILDRVRGAYMKRFPIENERVRLELLGAEYDQKKSIFTLADTKKALLTGGRLAVPLHGHFRLSDKATGEPLEEKRILMANVPYFTDRGTFINGGVEWATQNQHRLRAGVFARQKDNGELESHINTRSGTGPQMRLFMEPDTGVYRVKINQANIKLYPILNSLGVKDEDLAKSWGPDVLKANQAAWDKQAVSKFHEKLAGSRFDPLTPDEAKPAMIAEKLKAMELDPEVVGRSLGHPHANVSPDLLVSAATRLLHINQGKAEQDDRDSLANKSFHSVDDFLEERVRKDADGLARTLAYKAGYDRTLKQLRPGHFTPQLEGLIVGNSLSMPISGINLMEFRDNSARLTQMGEGGISSMDAVPISSRNVHTSQFGFVDPIRSSESRAIGIDQRFAYKVKKGTDNQIYAPFKNRKTGETEWLNPSNLYNKVISFSPAPIVGDYDTYAQKKSTQYLSRSPAPEARTI